MIKKKIKITSENGYVLVNDRNIVFLAKGIPENAVVDCVMVNGEHLCDMFDIAVDTKTPKVFYPCNKMFDDHRVVAVMFVKDGTVETDLLQLASIGEISEFDVIYHEEYIVEV